MVEVIVVDDDKNIVQLYSDILEQNGIKVVGTGNDGKEAVDLFKKHMPDLIILSWEMRGYDGIYAINNIRNESPQAKIIVLTWDIENISSKSELVAIIEKPVTTQKLLEAVRKVTN